MLCASIFLERKVTMAEFAVKNKTDKYEIIMEKKLSTPIDDLCKASCLSL